MQKLFSISKIVKLLMVLLSVLLAGCTTVRHSMYKMALAHEHWKAGLEEKTLDWDGKPISYLENTDDGTKQTIIMIHGFGANKENWVRFAAYLTKDYHVVAIDLPGHGESVKDLNMTYRWEDQVQYVHDILTRLNINKFHMAGNSMGGAISCLYAVKYPDQVQSLLLIDPAGIYRYECELNRLLKEGKNPLIVKCEDDFDALMDFAMEKKPYIPRSIISVMAEKAVENQVINKKIFADIHNDNSFAFEYEIKKISAPTLIMWGAQDRVISAKNADIFKEMIPNSQKIIFDGVGHAPMIEVPEKATKDYRDFLVFL
jgi:abhydrolase domain-containing protein 6